MIQRQRYEELRRLEQEKVESLRQEWIRLEQERENQNRILAEEREYQNRNQVK